MPDVDSWAWAKRARSLQKYSPHDVTVDIVMQRDFTPDMPDRYDGTLIFSWPDSPCCDGRVWTFVANEGLMYPWNPQAENYVERTASRSKNRDTAAQRIPTFRGVITINHRTVEFLQGLNHNTHLLRTGVDCDAFRPLRPVRTSPPYRIGWCGKAFDDPAKWTPKGYHEVLLPLMERFRGDERIEWVVNRRDASDALSEAEMVEWYNEIDLLLITSCSEGTPSTLLEAMACGRVFVSTDVGIARLADGYIQRSSADGSISTRRVCERWYQPLHVGPPGGWVSDWLGSEIIFLVTNPLYLSNDGPACRVAAEQHFNWKSLAEQWLRLLLT